MIKVYKSIKNIFIKDLIRMVKKVDMGNLYTFKTKINKNFHIFTQVNF